MNEYKWKAHGHEYRAGLSNPLGDLASRMVIQRSPPLGGLGAWEIVCDDAGVVTEVLRLAGIVSGGKIA